MATRATAAGSGSAASNGQRGIDVELIDSVPRHGIAIGLFVRRQNRPVIADAA